MKRALPFALAALIAAGCTPDKAGSDVAGGTNLKAYKPVEMLEAGAKAPDFALKGTDGKEYTLASLTADGPAFVYVVKSHCSANPTAAPLVASIFNAYGKKINAFGLSNGAADETKTEASGYSLAMPFLVEGTPLIDGLGLKASQHVYVFGKDGKITQVFHGYGKESLTALNQALAKQAGVEPAKIDLSAAPDGVRYG